MLVSGTVQINMKLIRPRFSLIELVVVIMVIMMLAGMLIPVIMNVRAKTMAAGCMSNLRQFGQECAAFRADNDGRMPGWLSNLVGNGYSLEPGLLICPQDYSEGFDGGRPGGDGDRYQASNYGGTSGSLPDDFPETDDTDRNNFPKLIPRNAEIKSCSYMYEFAGCMMATDTDGDTIWTEDWFPPASERSWNNIKEIQLRDGHGTDLRGGNGSDTKEWDYSLFPSTRCFYHWGKLLGKEDYILNIGYDGSFFPSRTKWELGIYE